MPFATLYARVCWSGSTATSTQVYGESVSRVLLVQELMHCILQEREGDKIDRCVPLGDMGRVCEVRRRAVKVATGMLTALGAYERVRPTISPQHVVSSP